MARKSYGGAVSFGDASGDNTASVGTEAWNISEGYAKIKVLRPIIELDLYESLARFGKREVEEELTPQQRTERRIEGFDRFLFALKQLIGNCKFSITRGWDEKLMDVYSQRIDAVERVSGAIADYKENNVTHETEIVINEEHFNKCLDILCQIKNAINEPINRAGLIFRQSDEMDIDEIMRQVEEGG